MWRPILLLFCALTGRRVALWHISGCCTSIHARPRASRPRPIPAVASRHVSTRAERLAPRRCCACQSGCVSSALLSWRTGRRLTSSCVARRRRRSRRGRLLLHRLLRRWQGNLPCSCLLCHARARTILRVLALGLVLGLTQFLALVPKPVPVLVLGLGFVLVPRLVLAPVLVLVLPLL
jgi:hypothetical protein